jgi:hypothetical protein
MAGSQLNSELAPIRDAMGKAREDILGDAYSTTYGLMMPDDPTWARRWGFEGLTSEKTEAVWKALKEVMSGSSSVLIPRDAATASAVAAAAGDLRSQRRAALQALLTPDESRANELRASETANTLRNGLAGTEYTEEQYLAMFPIRQAFDEKWIGKSLDAERSRQKQAELKEVISQMEAVLGHSLPPSPLLNR